MLRVFQRLYFRPSRHPVVAAPFTVRSVGHYQVAEYQENREPRGFTQLFWMLNGEILFQLGKRRCRAGAGEVFWLGPEEAHKFRTSGEAQYRWLTFDGGLLAAWLKRSVLRRRPMKTRTCPEALFRSLEELITLPDRESERECARVGYAIVLAASEPASGASTEAGSELSRAARVIIEQQHTRSGFGIDALAGMLKRHRSSVFRAFQRDYGMSPIDYLKRLRVRQAIALLRDTSLQISEVAHAAGFREPGYFSKAIREATGESPRSLRLRLRETGE